MQVRKRRRADDAALLDPVERRPSGAWVVRGMEAMSANHVPFFVDRTRGGRTAPWPDTWRAIVGIEIPIGRLGGKVKASRDEDMATADPVERTIREAPPRA